MRFLIHIITFFSLFIINNISNATYVCPSETTVENGSKSSIVAKSTTPSRKLEPEFFGFNIEWVEFQNSLYNPQTRTVRSNVISLLQSFPGAIYRFPGGSISNTYDWRDTVGPLSLRPKRKFVDWADPFQANFGIDEYLQFVKAVNGKVWYVSNLYGNITDELSAELLSKQAKRLAEYFQSKTPDYPGIFRWELGNELDRGNYQWSPEKFAAVAKDVVKQIKLAEPSAKFASLMEEYSPQASKGLTSTLYNTKLSSALFGYSNDYILHFYYGSEPGGQPIISSYSGIAAICRAITDAYTVAPTVSPSFWLTEHAAVFPGAWTSGWEKSWQRTGDLQAAISAADTIIALAQIPEVKGALIHALHGTGGPWPLFHKAKDGSPYPGAVYWALHILRNAMLENVLPTRIISTNNTTFGYDIRSVVMTNASHSKYSVWVINRAGKTLATTIQIPGSNNQSFTAKQVSITNTNIRANNYYDANQVKPIEKNISMNFDKNGFSSVILPPYSVSTFSF